MRIIACCLGIVIELFTYGVMSQELSRAERPDVKVGDQWVTRSKDIATGEYRAPSTTTVSEVTADSILVKVGSRTERLYTRDWNFRETKVAGQVTYAATPFRYFYQFPLEVGKKWEGAWETTSARQTNRWSGKVVVEKIESVTVPAGVFQAFKLKFEGNYNASANIGTGSWSGTVVETLWYSPEVKRFIKIEFQDIGSSYNNRIITELQSFKLAP